MQSFASFQVALNLDIRLQVGLQVAVQRTNLHWWDVTVYHGPKYFVLVLLLTVLFFSGIYWLVSPPKDEKRIIGLAMSGGAAVVFVLLILAWMHTKWQRAAEAMEMHVKALHLLYSEDLGPRRESDSQKVVYKLVGVEIDKTHSCVYMLLENGTVASRKPNWAGF